jgi:hypothetical protein
MHSQVRRAIIWPVLALSTSAWAQQANSCASLMYFKAPSVEISKAAPIAAGTTEPNPWGPGQSAPIPAYCRVEGVMNRRTGVGGEEFGISFALAMPDKWNGDFLMQGGGWWKRSGDSPAWFEWRSRHTRTHARVRGG